MKRTVLSIILWVAFIGAGAVLAHKPIPQPQAENLTTQPPRVASIKSEVVAVEATPTPTPTPTVAPTKESVAPSATPTPVATPTPLANTVTGYMDRSTIIGIISKWAAHYGLEAGWLIRVAECESTFDPAAINPYYSDGGNPTGLFQFVPPTFYHYAQKAGIVGANIWNVEHQSQTAAYMFSIGESKQWECK